MRESFICPPALWKYPQGRRGQWRGYNSGGNATADIDALQHGGMGNAPVWCIGIVTILRELSSGRHVISSQGRNGATRQREAQMKKRIEGTKVIFEFEGLETVEFDCTKMSQQNLDYAVPFGMCHRLGDMAAIPRKDGIVITEAMRRDAVLEGKTHYESGATEWNLKAGPRAAPQNPTILAIAAKMGISYTEAEAEIQKRMLAELSE